MNQIIPDNSVVSIVKDKPLTTPVLFLIFNRPDLTAQVFDAIRKARPQKLFVRADGPRSHKPDDIKKCRTARDIVKEVDWACDVRYNFSDRNLGCGAAISTGLTWFFDNVSEGIILEDDCLPSQSFFWFCQEMLNKYRCDNRVMQISGNNYLFGKKQFNSSYYFSKLNDIWGWATWKRAWDYFDINMSNFPEFKKTNQLENYFEDPEIAQWMMHYFTKAFEGKAIWSPAWSFAMCCQNALTIVSAVNLIQNIGFARPDSTCSSGDTWQLYIDMKTYELNQIVHPRFLLPDREADRIRFEIVRKTDPCLINKNTGLKSLIKKTVPHKVYLYLKKLKSVVCKQQLKKHRLSK